MTYLQTVDAWNVLFQAVVHKTMLLDGAETLE